MPSGPIFGATDDTIFAFTASGVIQNKYPVMGYNDTVVPESLKITSNGHLLYVTTGGGSNNTSGYQLNIIGATKLVIGNDSIATPMPTTTAYVNFTVGHMTADPVRDLVYVADQTDADLRGKHRLR